MAVFCISSSVRGDSPATHPARQIVVRVIEAESKHALTGAVVSVAGKQPATPFSEPDYSKIGVTDEAGQLNLPADAVIAARGAVRIKAEAEGCTPAAMSFWIDEYLYEPVELPLDRATTIGGTIKDEQGEPIAGVPMRVTISSSGNSLTQLPGGVPVKADAQGRWQCNSAPAPAQVVELEFFHPDYVSPFANTSTESIKSLRDQSAVTILPKGHAVSGVVHDAG